MENLYYKYVSHPTFIDTSESHTNILHNSKKVLGETYWTMNATQNNMYQYFSQFYNKYITHFNNIAIDGPTACGKSSLIEEFNPMKVNQIYNLNENNAYNIYPEMSISYLLLNEQFSKYDNIVVDRSVISNLGYLMAYDIMNVLTNQAQYTKSMFALCEDFILTHNLKPTLNYIRNKKFNVLILLDSSFEHSAIRTNNRGLKTNSASDVVKSLCKEYHKAQIAAFSFFANYMQYPCIDFDYVRTSYNVQNDVEMFESNSKAFKEAYKQSKFIGSPSIPKEYTIKGAELMKCLHYTVLKNSNR